MKSEDRVERLWRSCITQENKEGVLFTLVVNPTSDGVSTLEINPMQDGVYGFDGVESVYVETKVVLIGVVKVGILARVELHSDEVGGGEAKVGGGGVVVGEEEG